MRYIALTLLLCVCGCMQPDTPPIAKYRVVPIQAVNVDDLGNGWFYFEYGGHKYLYCRASNSQSLVEVK